MMDIASKEDPRQNWPPLYTMSLYHCMAQSLFYEGSEGLGTAWGNVKAKKMVTEAGFNAIREIEGPEPMYLHLMCDK